MVLWRQQLRSSRYDSYNRTVRSRRILRLAKFGFIGVVGLFIVAFLVFPLFAFDLPSPDKIVRREGFSTKILDRNGNTLYDIFADQKRTPVTLDKIPQDLRDATVAIEDKNFYEHKGFDPTGILRAMVNIVLKGKLQGGSTLTQQLVKNVLLTPDRTVFRKVREFILATQIERKYSKDEILQMYLNEAPYGGTAWGVEAAAETYLDKKVSNLTLLESAVLAGFPQRPSLYSPYSSEPKAYVARTQNVLRRMREDGHISDDEEKGALRELPNIVFQEKGANFKAPHFVQYVQRILEERYGERVVEQGGLKVTTTLDLELQEKAQGIVAAEIEKVKSMKISNGAAIIVDPETGEILAMVGSRGFSDPEIDGQVNVVLSHRQPGSSFKPFTYVTALKKGYTASTLIMDVPTEFPGGAGQPMYKPVNYDGKYRGPVQVRFALGNSINVPAVKMLATVGIKDTLQTAYDMGITTLPPTQETLNRVGLSLTLGGGEVRLLDMAGAYSAFFNQGYKVEPTAVLKVEDADGKVLEENQPKKGRQVLSESEAFIIADILSDNKARQIVFGPNNSLNIAGWQIGAKTGTTNDRRDNWTLGGNQHIAVGVWVGNNDNSPMGALVSGVSGAAPIWRKIILEALNGLPRVRFEPPDGVVQMDVDEVSGYRAHGGYPSRLEYFIKGTEPQEDSVHVRLKVCKSDGKLASPADISSGNSEEKEYFVFKEEDPASADGINRWQKGVLNWLATQADPRYHPPIDYCGASSPVLVEFSEPGDRTQHTNNFHIKIRAESTVDIERVELYINGENKRNFDSGGPYFEYDASLSNGIYTIKAKARDKNGKEAERTIVVGVNTDPNATASPSPTP